MVDIKEWRQEFGITQQALAKASGLDVRWIGCAMDSKGRSRRHRHHECNCEEIYPFDERNQQLVGAVEQSL